MAQVDREVVRVRFERVLNELDAIEADLPSTLAAYQDPAQETLRYALEHRLFMALQAVLDVATHIAVVSDYPGLDSYSDALRALTGMGVVSSETSALVVGAAGLRNAIAHGYLELDHDRVYEALCRTEDIRRLTREIWDWVGEQTPDGTR